VGPLLAEQSRHQKHHDCHAASGKEEKTNSHVLLKLSSHLPNAPPARPVAT
jgi:hypothetical protein